MFDEGEGEGSMWKFLKVMEKGEEQIGAFDERGESERVNVVVRQTKAVERGGRERVEVRFGKSKEE